MKFQLKFKSEKDVLLKELFRKSVHMCCGLVPLALRFAFWPVIILFSLILVVFLISEIFRLKNISLPLITNFTKLAVRKGEEQKLAAGPVFMVLGFILTAFLFPLEYASAGIYALAFGDGTASLVGKAFGRIRIGNSKKTLEGSMACFVSVFIVIVLMSNNFLISIITAFVVTVLEYLPLKSMDNFIIPLFTSAVYCLLQLIIK